MRLKDRIAVVAGGAGGIGSAICRRFLEEGATVVCADLSPERACQLVDPLAEAGRPISFTLLDAADSASWDSLASAVIAEHGKLDILVTAIYSGQAGSVVAMSDESWNTSFSGTSSGVFFGMRACCAVMPEGGAIVNIASIVAHGGAPENIGYSAAKSAVIAMSRAAATKLARRGIRVNVVTPGLIQTGALDAILEVVAGTDRTTEQVRSAYLRHIPMRRVGEPAEIANAVLFLASDEASYVTGAELIVDGGTRTL